MTRPFKKKFEGLDVLVTGHTGFKGSWISTWLNELGANVIGYSLDIPTTPSNFELSHLAKRVTDIRGDIRDADKIKTTIEEYKPQLVFHLAAQPIVMRSHREPKLTIDTNVGGTVNVLEAVRQTQPHVKALVCITSDKCYKDQRSVWGYREIDTLGGEDPYSASKAMAEIAIESFNRSYFLKEGGADTAIASVRAGNVIGGGDFADSRLVPDCMRALMDNKSIIVRNPNSVRPWQIVFEPLSGYLWLAANLLEHGKKYAEAWNFGPPEQKSISARQIADKSIELWGGGKYTVDPNAPKIKEVDILSLSWEKAANLLNWAPAYNWEMALGQTVNWFKTYSQNKGRESFDMYDHCARDLEEYTNRAKELGIEWAL